MVRTAKIPLKFRFSVHFSEVGEAMGDLKGSQYVKDGIWWVKFPLPHPITVDGKVRTRIESSVRKYWKRYGIDGKGDAGRSGHYVCGPSCRIDITQARAYLRWMRWEPLGT